jgi:hypothetical protein
VAGLRRACGALAERIETAGIAQVDAADLRIRLRAGRPADDAS